MVTSCVVWIHTDNTEEPVLKMEAADSSKTSVYVHKSTLCHVQEYSEVYPLLCSKFSTVGSYAVPVVASHRL